MDVQYGGLIGALGFKQGELVCPKLTVVEEQTGLSISGPSAAAMGCALLWYTERAERQTIHHLPTGSTVTSQQQTPAADVGSDSLGSCGCRQPVGG